MQKAKGQFISNNIFATKCYCLRSRYKDMLDAFKTKYKPMMDEKICALSLRCLLRHQ